MKIQICVALPAETISDLASMIKKAETAHADLIEVRLDHLKPDALNAMDQLEEVVRKSHVPLVATNRHHAQGGHCTQNEEERIRTLLRAAEIGFQYVDIELTAPNLGHFVKAAKERGAKLIVSHHDFSSTPSTAEMEKTMKAQIESGAEVCKLITTATDVADNVRCMLLAHKMSKATKVVCFAMGRKGASSRVLSPLFGSYFTYASLEENLETASGQLSIADLRRLYERLGVY